MAGSEPAAVAYRHQQPDGRWATADWRTWANQIAALADQLADLGLDPGDRVGIIAATGHRWHLAEMACIARGGVVVGIDPHQPPDQIAFILRDCGARGIVIDAPDILDVLPENVASSLDFAITTGSDVTKPPQGPIRVVPWPKHYADDTANGDHPLRKTLAAAGNRPADTATIIYTSGTTGRPKAIAVTHGQLMAACRAIQQTYGPLHTGEATLCWLPMAHLFQRMINLYSLHGGATIHFVADPRRVVEAAATVEPAVFCAVPHLYEKVAHALRQRIDGLPGPLRRLFDLAINTGIRCAQAAEQGRPLSAPLRAMHRVLDRLALRRLRRVFGRNVRFMVTGTAPTPRWVLEFFHGIGLPLYEAYGITENVIPMAANHPSACRFGSVGRPMPGNEIILAGDGEVLVRGEGVFRGYLGQDDAGDLFTSDGYFRTGDLGRFDADGFLYLTGRKSEIIKTSTGRRLSPARIEAAYRRCPQFDQVVVVGNGRKYLTALIHLATAADGGNGDNAVPDATAIENALAAAEADLAEYERVAAYALLERPLSIAQGELTPTLKPRRAVIEQRYAAAIDAARLRRCEATATPVTGTIAS